jgi:hypothetical protein
MAISARLTITDSPPYAGEERVMTLMRSEEDSSLAVLSVGGYDFRLTRDELRELGSFALTLCTQLPVGRA